MFVLRGVTPELAALAKVAHFSLIPVFYGMLKAAGVAKDYR
ncbi:hypothetical protein (plasmid) [Metabacillus dongyingensis]|nr:hypothetical protein [Metabacillus dongyingensis]